MSSDVITCLQAKPHRLAEEGIGTQAINAPAVVFKLSMTYVTCLGVRHSTILSKCRYATGTCIMATAADLLYVHWLQLIASCSTGTLSS